LKCPKCGIEHDQDYEKDARFCSACGAALIKGGGVESESEEAKSVEGEDTSEVSSESVGSTDSVSPIDPIAPIEKMSVPTLVILTIVTFGIYAAVWFLKRLDSFNELRSEVKLTQGVFSFIIAGFVVNLSIIAYIVMTGTLDAEGMPTTKLAENLFLTSDIVKLVVHVALLVQAFKARSILMDHYNGFLKREESFSWPATLIFGVFYLQFKINRLNT
jgi:hypothetical protein